jgi:hypothetical protein
MQDWIACKKLGRTTLSHPDNLDEFPRLYRRSTGAWARRFKSMRNQVHILAEQAAIQMALHLSDDYSVAAAQILHYALQERNDDNDCHGHNNNDGQFPQNRNCDSIQEVWNGKTQWARSERRISVGLDIGARSALASC